MIINQSEEKILKKEPSQDEEENEDEGSTANAEEYDPMEAEDDDDDDGTFNFCNIIQSIVFTLCSSQTDHCEVKSYSKSPN